MTNFIKWLWISESLVNMKPTRSGIMLFFYFTHKNCNKVIVNLIYSDWNNSKSVCVCVPGWALQMVSNYFQTYNIQSMYWCICTIYLNTVWHMSFFNTLCIFNNVSLSNDWREVMMWFLYPSKLLERCSWYVKSMRVWIPYAAKRIAVGAAPTTSSFSTPSLNGLGKDNCQRRR